MTMTTRAPAVTAPAGAVRRTREESRVVDDPMADERRAWRGVRS